MAEISRARGIFQNKNRVARILKKTYLVQRKLPVKAGRYVRVNYLTYCCHMHTNNQQFAIASY